MTQREIKTRYEADEFTGQTFIEYCRYGNPSEFFKQVKSKFGLTSEQVFKAQIGDVQEKFGMRFKISYFISKEDPSIVVGKCFYDIRNNNAEYHLAITPDEQKKIDDDKWGMWITPRHGQAYLSTGTSNSSGPWTHDCMDFNISDKRHDLEYDDEFDRGGIKPVKVKKINNEWVMV